MASRNRQFAARRRCADDLRAAGIEAPVESIAVEAGVSAYHPLWLGVLRNSTGDRLVAIDGALSAKLE